MEAFESFEDESVADLCGECLEDEPFHALGSEDEAVVALGGDSFEDDAVNAISGDGFESDAVNILAALGGGAPRCLAAPPSDFKTSRWSIAVSSEDLDAFRIDQLEAIGL